LHYDNFDITFESNGKYKCNGIEYNSLNEAEKANKPSNKIR
jgi:hypothetical protein